MPMLDYLRQISEKTKSDELRWMLTDPSEAASDARRWVEAGLCALSDEKRKRVAERLSKGDTAQTEATLCELVTMVLLAYLGADPIWEPELSGKTPDFRVTFGDTVALGDVLQVSSPMRTICEHGDGLMESHDAGDRAQKISEPIQAKVQRYDKLGFPLVFVLFLGDTKLLNDRHVEDALYGWSVSELSSGLLTKQLNDRKGGLGGLGGLLLPMEGSDRPSARSLSAVLVCHWFDSLNAKRPGKRLYARALHHFDPIVPLPPEALGYLPQVTWTAEEDGWRHSAVHNEPRVARLTSDFELEWGISTASCPW